MLLEIAEKQPKLSKSERKVALTVLNDPQRAILNSIAQLARLADVSEPTVNRFCHSMGCSGFPDFKLKLAQSLASGASLAHHTIEPNDTVSMLSEKIWDTASAIINETRNNISAATLDQAISILAQARRIEFFGIGASAPVALDAQQKFIRLDVPVVARTDTIIQRMSAAASPTGAVIVPISTSGQTSAIIESVQHAKEAGANIVGLTNPNSPLGRTCNTVLATNISEDNDIYSAMGGRIIQMLILDILATGVFLQRGPSFTAHLRKIRENNSKSRLGDSD